MQHFYFRQYLLSFLASRKISILLFSATFVLAFLFLVHEFSPLPMRSLTKNLDWDWQKWNSTLEDLSYNNTTSTYVTSEVDWSQFAYVQYVTDTNYLCNSVMLFEILHRLGSKADRLIMYPTQYNPSLNNESTEARLLVKAQTEYNVKLAPIDVLQKDNSDYTWEESYTKLLAFNQTQYKRVLSLDSDSTVLQHMDELFLLPPAPIALPRAYWLGPADHVLSSQLMVIQPSKREFSRIQRAIDTASDGEFDMEIINKLYGDSAMILPHRIYDLVTGELRSKNHSNYFGSKDETWNSEVVLKEAKFVHFSDWPVPKPWMWSNNVVVKEKQPDCVMNDHVGQLDCTDRDLWLGFYEDFRKRRKELCNLKLSSRKRSVDKEFGRQEPGAWEFVI